MTTTVMASASGPGQYKVKGDFVMMITKEDMLHARRSLQCDVQTNALNSYIKY